MWLSMGGAPGPTGPPMGMRGMPGPPCCNMAGWYIWPRGPPGLLCMPGLPCMGPGGGINMTLPGMNCMLAGIWPGRTGTGMCPGGPEEPGLGKGSSCPCCGEP